MGHCLSFRSKLATPVDAVLKRRKQLGFDWWVWNGEARELLRELLCQISDELRKVRKRTLDNPECELFELTFHSDEVDFVGPLRKLVPDRHKRRASTKEVMIALLNAAGEPLYMSFAFPELFLCETRVSNFKCVCKPQRLPDQLRLRLRAERFMESVRRIEVAPHEPAEQSPPD